MKILLDKKECEDFFERALSNGLDYVTSGYGLAFEYEAKDYVDAHNRLKIGDGVVCFEDVIMEMLRRGNKLELIDEEGDESWSITIDDVHNMVDVVPVRHLLDMAKEHDDAITADAIIQCVFMKEIIFG